MKHVEAYKKSYYKTRICALSWLIAKIKLRCTVSKTSKSKYPVSYRMVTFHYTSNNIHFPHESTTINNSMVVYFLILYQLNAHYR